MPKHNKQDADPRVPVEISRRVPHLASLWDALSANVEYNLRDIHDREAVKALKLTARGLGLTGAGWRYLLMLPSEEWVSALVKLDYPEIPSGTDTGISEEAIRHTMRCIDLLAVVRELPASVLVYQKIVSSVRSVLSGSEMQASELRAMIRAAFRESYNRPGNLAGFLAELEYVLEWFVQRLNEKSVNNQLDNNQLRASWRWFRKQAEAYFVPKLKLPPYGNVDAWQSLVGPYQCCGQEVIPLVTTQDLVDEGVDMKHCARRYAARCVAGISRIFAIRFRGDPLATFELVCRNEKWVLVQVRGWRNRRPRPVDVFIAKHTLNRYRKAAMGAVLSVDSDGASGIP